MTEKVKIKISIGAAMVLLILAVGIYYVQVSAAATIGTVHTSGGTLTVRSGPGTSYSKLGALSNGSTVTISGEEKGWYRIVYKKGNGYVSGDYIKNVHTMDSQYYNNLIKAGFPESYAQSLTALHDRYPNWKFEPVLTGLDWAEVIRAESGLGKNLVQKSGNDAQKSTASGAYNWQTNSWYGFDGPSWVCASEEMIAYAMDPRNFLDEEHIFQFEYLGYQPYQTKNGTAQLLKNSFMSGDYKDTDKVTRNYAQTFVETGKGLGVSPYHLAARCLQEQGTKGTSGSISGNYKGYRNYFNYFNVRAYPANGKTAIENGLIYAKSQGWNTRYKSIQGGSAVVADSYVLKGQNTVYFQKFNVVNKSNLYGHQYMTNVQAAISEGRNSRKAYSDLQQAFVFRIPVYNHMPKTPVSMPAGGNPNNWLSSLQVKGYNLTPAFQGAVTEYSFIVEENVESLTVSAAPVANTSTVKGTGTVELKHGKNTISIVCRAQNGTERKYTLTVVRKGSDKPAENKEPVKYGDINQDNKISNADLVLLKKYILKTENLTGEKLKAADANKDGKISNADLVLLKKHILGIETIR